MNLTCGLRSQLPIRLNDQIELIGTTIVGSDIEIFLGRMVEDPYRRQRNLVVDNGLYQASEIGFKAVEDKVHLHDLHSTILRLMGLDHEKLSVNVKGLNMRLTDLHGYHDIYEKLTARKSPP
jgi:hypothetical protein